MRHLSFRHLKNIGFPPIHFLWTQIHENHKICPRLIITSHHFIQKCISFISKWDENAFDTCKRCFLCLSVNNRDTYWAHILRYSKWDFLIKFHENYQDEIPCVLAISSTVTRLFFWIIWLKPSMLSISSYWRAPSPYTVIMGDIRTAVLKTYHITRR